MGGDHAPREVIAGAVAAARDLRDLDVSVLLVGPIDVVNAEVARASDGAVPSALSVLDASEYITMDDAPLAALRRKPQASIKVAAEAVARGDAQAVYSAGHTGATLLSALAAFGHLEGVERPALAVLIPTQTGSAVLLDTGATLECRAEHLRVFGVMGAAYAQVVLGMDRPRVGLLSVGEEAGKGTELIREAHGLLAASSLNFVGNVEAHDLFKGGADVIVCDGFTGNIALKVGEGLVDVLETLLRQAVASSSPAGAEVGAAATDGFSRLRRRVDSAEYGAAPLLGVKGLTLVGHGRSDARAVKNGIATAARLARGQMLDRLHESLSVR